MAEQIQINALIRSDLDTGEVTKKVASIQKLLKKLDLNSDLEKKFNGLFTDFNSSIEKINNQFSKGFDTKGAVKSLDDLTKEMRQTVTKIGKEFDAAASNKELIKLPPDQKKKVQEISSSIGNLNTELDAVKTDNVKKLNTAFSALKAKTGKDAGAEALKLVNEGEAKQAIGLLDQVIAKREQTKLGGKGKDTFADDTESLKELKKVITAVDTETGNLTKEIEDLSRESNQIKSSALKELEQETEKSETGMKQLKNAVEKTEYSLRDAGKSANQMSSEMDEMRSQIQYFFSLSNAIQLVGQALRETFEAAKELDAAMTETAVVTDFSVGDMWDMLPEYTKTAQELGATTQGVYETLTLFYQQGLDNNEAMTLGIETLKMARIAGMDYEEATSKMTAALRGFNMELNQTSVERVNDVYSELAAITASDTDQIATAMTKTASIANSANMEFETTAAFLAQIVETTQESAETAGTAMKTVIARFTELKKDPGDIGEVDGEIIDANKIETALRSIGVPLRDVQGQFRDLDDVFLDIAAKWDGLDTNTQRYIATIAAGSRQQSRFIAMMSDYDRTMELVNAANNSAGASQEQFNKTLESLEVKLNQLKNTWQEFALGIAEDSTLKALTEALNTILQFINELTDGPGILGSIEKILFGIVTFFAGKKLINILSQSFLPSIAAAFTGGGKKAGISFSGAFMAEVEKTNRKARAGLVGLNPKKSKELRQAIDNGTKGSEAQTKKNISVTEQQTNAIREQTAAQSENVAQQKESIAIDEVNEKQTKDGVVANEAETATIERKTAAEEKEQAQIGESIAIDEINEKQTKDGVVVNEAETATIERKTAALTGLATLYGLTAKQAEQAYLIAQSGVSQDYAAIAASKGLTNAELEQLAIEKLGTAADTKQIAKEKEKIIFQRASLKQKWQLIAAKLRDVISTKLVTGADKDSTRAKIGAAVANMSLTASTLVLTAAVLALVIAVVAIVAAYKKQKEAAEEAAKTQIDNANKTQEETASNRELARSFDELIEKYKEGAATKQEVADASDELIEEYGLEGKAVGVLAGNYENLAKAIREARLEEERSNVDAQNAGINASRGLLVGQLSELHSLSTGASLSDEIEADDEFKNEVKELAEKFGLEADGSFVGKQGQLHFGNFSDFTDEELVGLSGFLGEYLNLLSKELEESGKEANKSEVYQDLTKVIEETRDNFSALSSSVSALEDSIEEIAVLEYENSAEEVVNLESYQRERDSLIQKAIDAGMEEKDAQRFALEYFNKQGIIYAGADSYLFELEIALEGKASEIEIVDQYLKGKISPETFIRIIGQIDIENSNNPEDINTQVGASLWKTAVNGADDFANAAKEISGYLNENFTLDGVDPNLISNFESQLKILQDVVPSGIDLMSSWNLALKKGTMGVSEFFIYLQNLLNQQSATAQMMALYQTAYGTPFSKETINALYQEYTRDGVTEERQDEILKQLGLSAEEFFDVQRRINWTEKQWDNYVRTGDPEDEGEGAYREYKYHGGSTEEIEAVYGDKFAAYYNGLSDKEKDNFWTLQTNDDGTITENFNDTLAQEWVDGNDLMPVPEHFGQGGGSGWKDYSPNLNSTNWEGYGTYQKSVYYGEIKSNLDENEQQTRADLDYAADQALLNVNKPYIWDYHPEAGFGNILPLIEHAIRYNDDEVKAARDLVTTTAEDVKNFETYVTEVTEAASSAKLGYDNSYGIETGMSDVAVDYYKRMGESKSAEGDRTKIVENYIDVEAAKTAASQFGLLQSQIEQIKNLTADGPIVDLSTFQQLKEINPEIAYGMKVLSDGTIDVSAGLELMTSKYSEQTDEIRGNTVATLQDALVRKQTLADNIKNMIKELETQIRFVENGQQKTVKLEEETAKTLNGLNEDEAFYRAKVNEQADKDISESSYDSAVNVVDNVASMTNAYKTLGLEIEAVHERMTELGDKNATWDISLIPDTSNFVVDQPTYSGEPVISEDYYSDFSDKIDDGAYDNIGENGEGIDLASAYELKAYLEATYNDLLGDISDIGGAISLALGGGKESDSGSSGTDKEIEKVDTLFNILQKITRLQELRNKLEKEYAKIIEEEIPNLEEVQKNLASRLALLAEENLLLLQKKAYQEAFIQQWIKENEHLSDYVWYDKELQKLQIDAEAINAISNSEKREEINDAISDGEKLIEDQVKIEEELFEIETQIEKLTQAGITDLDKQLNKVEEVAELERSRATLGSQINLTLAERNLEEEKYLDQLKQEREYSQQNLKDATELKKLREEDLKEYLKQIQEQGYSEYMSYDFETGVAYLNKELIDTLPEELQKVITEVFDGFSELSESYEEAADAQISALEENTSALQERREEGIEALNYIKDLLIESRQREIDFFSEASTAISDSNSKILDSITESLDQQRQARENQETESEIADMRNRLAYLQMDTSGANASEILSLQEQLKEKEEDYTDTLIDQKIDELQKQNDLAAEQRERQIALMEWQLDNEEKTGKFSEQAEQLLKAGIDPETGVILSGSHLEKLIKESDELKGLSHLERLEKLDEIAANLIKYINYISKDRLVGTRESGIAIGTDVSKYLGLKAGTAQVTGEGEVTLSNGYKFTGVTTDLSDNPVLDFAQGVGLKELVATAATARDILRGSVGLSNSSGKTSEKDILKARPEWDVNKDGKLTADDARTVLRASVGLENLNPNIYNETDLLLLLTAKGQGLNVADFKKQYKEIIGQDPIEGTIDDNIQHFYSNLMNTPKKFATGGLADYTGPAWLDGTKSRPELVLNQRDTKNFLQLKDVLSHFMSNNGSKGNSAENTGDNYFEIHLNVEKITSDYDVEQLASKIKTIIAEDANSRGVNSIYRRR